MPKPFVEITQSGRGGSIYYHKGEHVVAFEKLSRLVGMDLEPGAAE